MWVVVACTLLAIFGSGSFSRASQEQNKDMKTPAGQAFHDWRTGLIATRYNSAYKPHQADPSHQPRVHRGGQQQRQHHQSNEEWVDIVAMRERLSLLKGPAVLITTHPAAARRLRIAKELLTQAGRDADTAAAQLAAATAAANVARAVLGPHGDSTTPQQQQQQQQVDHKRHGMMALNSESPDAPDQPVSDARAAAFPSRATTSIVLSGMGSHGVLSDRSRFPETIPIAGTGSMDSKAADGVRRSTHVQEAQLFSQLTEMMRQQPYKPLKTDISQLEVNLMHFVHRGPQARLYLSGQPWVLKGLDVPEALQLAAGGPVTRSQLLYLLDRAQTLGLNTVRFRAFADGATGIGSAGAPAGAAGSSCSSSGSSSSSRPTTEARCHVLSLQPAPGILNGTMLREGLDWLVHECGLRGIRLLPVLTNGASTDGGGMKQYTDWVDSDLTISDFYTNDTVKSVFLDYVAAMLGHVSALSEVPLREDPVIIGWQLAEDASHPGHISSQKLLGWLRQLGVFVKQRAPHQLLLSGVLDFFGHNSPHHLQHNPQLPVFSPASHSPHLYEARCHGVDFWLHNQMPEMDATLSGVFPDLYLSCNATCKLSWVREWIRAHLRDSLRINKPLILGGIGALRPHSWRLSLLQIVHEEIERALKHGHPLGGFLLSGLSHPDMQDTSGWSVYYSSKGIHRDRPHLHNLNEQAVQDVKWRRFLNYDSFLSCLADTARGASNDRGEAGNKQVWVDGWEDVVRAVVAISHLGPDLIRN